MRARGSTLRTAWVVLCAGALAATVLPATGAGSPPGAGGLRAKEGTLAERSRQALLDLYALDSQLAQASSQAASLDSQLASVRSERRAVNQQLRVARASLAAARLALGRTVRQIYESGFGLDPIAILLGASSFDDAMNQLEGLRQLTQRQRVVVAQVSARGDELQRLSARLAGQSASLQEVAAQAHAAAGRIAQTRDSRASYIRRLQQEQTLTRRQLARVQQASARAAARSQRVNSAVGAGEHATAAPNTTSETTTQPPGETTTTADTTKATAAPPAPPGPPHKGSTMAVVATAYDLPGTTASGLPVGIGIVATDPTVIPLGTRFYVPGYGPAVAADTGSAIKGARIDVWLPPDRIGSWSTRTVTITFL